MQDRTQYVYDFDESPPVPAEQLRRLIGGKAASIVVMSRDLALPVPPGFTITTPACRAYLAGRWPPGLDDEVRIHVERLGERVGHRFGDRADPLLVSVRSGAPVSMPGMMDTILNLGLNEATARGLGRSLGDPDVATDCLRRFRQGYREVTGADEVPDDPWLQLRGAIEAVFRSWNSERARVYRRQEGIPDHLATAVTVQAMVFGNRGRDSGSGVLFTRNPATGEPTIYGDVLFDAQGEDVVAGGHATQPIAVLEERLPAVAAELRRHAHRLERHFGDLCDIEFTIERGRLWLLQSRIGKRSPRAALRMAIDMAEDVTFPCSREEAVRRVARHLADPPRVFVADEGGPMPIASGLPASPGVAVGAIVTSSDAAEQAAAAGEAVILVREETSPQDVRGMARAAGLLTARGGLASHAAVVARGWGIPAVVGAAGVRPGLRGVEIDGRRLAIGERISIDGSTGRVYAGELIGRWEVAPEASVLLSWAAQLGIDPGPPPPASAHEAARDGASSPDEARPAFTADDVLRLLLVRGAVPLEEVDTALGIARRDDERVVETLTVNGLARTADGTLRLTAPGRLKALAAFAADRASIGEARCVELLDAFHVLDRRVKEIVTAWQVRDLGGAQTLNDHGDVAYDAQVLDRLAALHSDAVEWLAPLASALPRVASYRSRLVRALDRARAGDQRYVASPRVDSYHTVWFELHEELIRLAGRQRSDEATAGRA